MKKWLHIVGLWVCVFGGMLGFGVQDVFGQKDGEAEKLAELEKEKEWILAEGYALFYREVALWQSNMNAIVRMEPHRHELGGYVTYQDEGQLHTIYYTEGERPEVLLRVVLDSVASPGSLEIDTVRRAASDLEMTYINVREKVVGRVYMDESNFFKRYPETQQTLHILPRTDNYRTQRDRRKGGYNVYLQTSPRHDDRILFGNDYLLEMDETLHIFRETALHDTLIVHEPGETMNGFALHRRKYQSRQLSITPTDICTLLLNREKADWSHYRVICRLPNGHVRKSIWDAEAETLKITEYVPKKNWKGPEPSK
ncbi:MAG: hypothetical protein AAF570_19800 [Bacteroidota bacterium]